MVSAIRATTSSGCARGEQMNTVILTLEPFAIANGQSTQSYKVKRNPYPAMPQTYLSIVIFWGATRDLCIVKMFPTRSRWEDKSYKFMFGTTCYCNSKCRFGGPDHELKSKIPLHEDTC
jgi:hypothetical protein